MRRPDWIGVNEILLALNRVEREFARIPLDRPVRTKAQREAAWADLDEPWAGWLARIQEVHDDIAAHLLVERMYEEFTPEQIAEIIRKADS